MSNRDAAVALACGVIAFVLGMALDDRGGFLKGAGAIAAVLGVAVLLWNLYEGANTKRD
jgi:hypothetical protein